MMKSVWKNNRGIGLVSGILLILLIILVVFLAYEILYVDLFDIVKKSDNPIGDVSNIVKDYIQTGKHEEKNEQRIGQNIEKIEPMINETNHQTAGNVNSTNNYYYSQLDDAGKTIYKGLKDNIENMKSGTYKIDFGTQFNTLLKSDNGDKKLNISFQSAWNAFTYDYPEIFYIDVTKVILTTKTTAIGNFATHKVSLSNDKNENYFTEGITSETEVRKREAYIQDIRDKIIASLQGYSEYEQVKYLHNWIIDNFEYDTTYQKKDIHNVYGALSNRRVVCEGYARTFKYILDGLGIENVLVSGTATNSSGMTESHAWNYVKLDGKWYGIDVTWDDPIIKGGGKLTNKLRYQYFLKGSDEFLKNHIEDGNLSENSISFKFPTLEKKNYEK